MTVGMGYDSWMSFEPEAAWGTELAAAKQYGKLRDESMNLDVVPIEYPGMEYRPSKIFNSKNVVGGTVSPEMHYNGFGKLIKQVLPDYTFAADTPVAGANTHTFKFQKALAVGFTLEVSKGDIPSTKVFKYVGCKVAEASFGIDADDLFRMALTLIAKSEESDVARFGAPSFPAYHPILWHYTGTVTVAGSTIDVKNFNVNLNNNIDRRFLLSKVTKEPHRMGGATVEGSVVGEFEDLTHYTKYAAGTEGALSFAMTSDEMITGATPYSLTMTATAVHLTGETPKVGDEGPIDIPLNFKAVGDEQLQIVLVNDDTTYA